MCALMRVRWLLISCAVLIAGCGQPRPLASSSSLTVVQMNQLPAPNRTDLVAADRPSLIGPLDTIGIDVFNVPELSREIQVDSSGRISMPLIGAIDARGKTSQELAVVIEASLRNRFVRNPQVTVNIKNSVSQVATVDGEVEQPGLYPVTNESTLLRAIASARGLSEFAKLDDVVVLRTVNNQRMAGVYNIAAIRRGEYPDPPIYANDLIVVGDSPARRLFRDLIGVSPLLAAPVIAVLQKL